MLKLLALATIILASAAVAECSAAADEEFNGPFPSWRDVKRDYRAIGDGKADDSAAFQAALDDLQKHEKAVVVYVPAGQYRITKTLKTLRKKHTDCMGVSLVGEDPVTTSLVWDGDPGGTVLQWDAWYSRISRLTLDAAGKAEVALQYGPAFSTHNETSDLIIKNATTGLLLGGKGYQGQAENEVLRCQFLHCQTGIMTAGWNSMDIWAWYCRFEDCGRGIHNVMGSGNAGTWVDVSGNPDGASANNQVSVFTGATGSAAGQYDVHDNGRLVVRGVYHERSSESLRHLAPLRQARVWLPQTDVPAGATDLRLYRITATGDSGAVVEFRGTR